MAKLFQIAFWCIWIRLWFIYLQFSDVYTWFEPGKRKLHECLRHIGLTFIFLVIIYYSLNSSLLMSKTQFLLNDCQVFYGRKHISMISEVNPGRCHNFMHSYGNKYSNHGRVFLSKNSQQFEISHQNGVFDMERLLKIQNNFLSHLFCCCWTNQRLL